MDISSESNDSNDNFGPVALVEDIRDRNVFSIEDDLFVKYFRLPKALTFELIKILRPHWNHPYRYKTDSIPFHEKVLTTLSFYANGGYQYCVGSTALVQLSQASVSRVLASISKLICDQITAKYIKFPQTESELNAAKQKFFQMHNIPGCVGIVDGTHIGVSKVPRDSESAYRNRKNVYSINTMIICSADLEIIAVNARYSGASHDSYIFRCSEPSVFLKNQFERTAKYNYANDPSQWTYLLADMGYALEPWLMRPYAHDDGSDVINRFNAKFRSIRSKIERLNGILKSVFRCLHTDRTLKYSHTKAANIIYACCGLYNFMKHKNYVFPCVDLELPDDVNHEPNANTQSHLFSDITVVRTREKLARII